MAIAYVQSNKTIPAGNVSANTIACTYSGAVTAGNLLVAFLHADLDLDGFTITVSDTVNGAWTKCGTQASGWSTLRGQMWYFPSTASGTPTLNVTYDVYTPANRALLIAEYSGILAASPYDTGAGNGTGTATTTPTTGNTGTPAVDGELFVCGIYTSSETVTFTAGTSLSYTKRFSQGDAFAYSCAWEDAVQSSKAATDAGWTLGTAQSYTTKVATFKPAADGGTGGLMWL